MPHLYAIAEMLADLRRRRREKKLSQAELGARSGMPQSQIARIEQGNRDVRLATLMELARALDLEPMLVPKEYVPVVRSLLGAGGPAAPRLMGNEPEDADAQFE